MTPEEKFKQDKKKYVCGNPWLLAEVFEDDAYMCCPHWLPEPLPNPHEIKKEWNGEKAQKIRDSILDGSYSYCREDRCPKLISLKEGKVHEFFEKDEFLKLYGDQKEYAPQIVKFNFDRSCNLKCPSCRLDFINIKGEEREKADQLSISIEEQLGEDLEEIQLTGTGDPFFSRTFRQWMFRFEPKNYPNLKRVHLHTNGTLWNRSNWERMSKIHPYVTSCEISVDAATKDTYENKVRIGGKWGEIVDNLNYISTLKYLHEVTVSFVMQQKNYTELVDFYKFIENIFSKTKKDWKVVFHRLNNYGHLSDKQFREQDISNPNHPEYEKFIQLYRELPYSYRIIHNLEVM